MKNQDYFVNNYTFIVAHMCLTSDKKHYIGNKKNRICRYCGEKNPVVTFKQKAHAIPEFTGNKSLIAYDECDKCNELFSRVIEDHFANYLGLERTLSQIHGKKGVPIYKGKNGKSRISIEERELKIVADEDDKICDLNLNAKTVEFTGYRQPYVPAAIFKCIVKMAIAIAPQEILSEFDHLSKWIRESEHKYATFPYKPLVALMQFTSGPMPYTGVSLFLLKRKPEIDDVPYLQFVVTFGNRMYQIVIPMPEQDKKLINVPIQLHLFPIPFSDQNEHGKTSFSELDLNGYELIKNEPHTMSMVFESITEVL